MLTVHTSTPPPSLPASVLNLRVSVSHTGVSSEGTAVSTMTLPRAWLSLTGWRLLSTAVKSGASLPALTSGPPSVIGLPLNITAPALSAIGILRGVGVSASQYTGEGCRMIGAGRSGEIGKRAALKMRCPQGPAGSSPASGTISFRALDGSRPRGERHD